MKRSLLLAFGAVLTCVVAVRGEALAVSLSSTEISLSLSLTKVHFFQGETIPVTLTFNNATGQSYVVEQQYGAFGSYGNFRIQAKEVNGDVLGDPLGWLRSFETAGSGLSSVHDLRGFMMTFPANFYVRFDHPGQYTIRAQCDGIQAGTLWKRDPARKPLSVVSNPVVITIDPLSAGVAQDVLTKARQLIVARDPKTRYEEYLNADHTLNFLDTPDDYAELRQLAGSADGERFWFGLLASPKPEEEAALLLDDIRTGRIIISPRVISLYQELKMAPP